MDFLIFIHRHKNKYVYMLNFPSCFRLQAFPNYHKQWREKVDFIKSLFCKSY